MDGSKRSPGGNNAQSAMANGYPGVGSASSLAAAAAAPKDDPRVEFMRRLVVRTFPGVKLDKLHKTFASDSVASLLFEFLHLADSRLLLFTDHGNEASGTVDVYAVPPPRLFSHAPNMCVLYIVKTKKAAVSLERMHDDVLTGTLERNALESLSLLLHEVLIPLIGNPRNQRLWPEIVTTSVINNVHGFFSSLQITVGQTKGATYLPLPWDQILMEHASGSALLSPSGTNSGGAGLPLGPGAGVKDQVHGLESCLITWTKQIKNILKQDPESMLSKRQQAHSGPMEELRFWAAKATNLNSIFAQLQSDSIRKVLQYLDASKSTYNVPFAKLCKEVFLARAEANDNSHFLQPLAKWFDGLSGAATFPAIRDLFRPIFHSVLLVWKCSRFYNTPTRLVVLIRQICNEIIRKAVRFLSGRKLFEVIDQDALEQTTARLLVSLQVCAHFKSVYFDYKARSSAEAPGNPWRLQNNALFVRLDAFLERCHDVLELTQTIQQFQKLAAMEIGGTKGKTLTTSVRQIHADFLETLLQIKAVHYDLMDLDAKHFEDDFYAFRTKNKELERRLASVINQAFDDARTVVGRFKCLDCFDELLERPIIKTELERKHALLIAAYLNDLHVVQQIFIESRERPPIPSNLPPFAGAVSWSRGLAERIRFPMAKLKTVAPRVVLEREDSKEAVKMYINILAMLQEYEVQMVRQWGVSIETSSKAKLKLPLIRRGDVVVAGTTLTDATVSVGPSLMTQSGSNAAPLGVLFVNFDPALVQLLREVKYFQLLGLEIPEDALAIYKKAEVFRRQTGNLELIVDMYNAVHASLLAVERPLVKSYLERMDQALNKGVKALNWKSHGIDVFLKEAMADVSEANALLSQMKTHQARVRELLAAWHAPPLLFERKTKTLSVDEFDELQRALCQHKYHVIKEGGNEIHRLLKDTLKHLRVSQGSPDWRAYVDFVSAMVEDGLTRVVHESLRLLRDQLDPRRIESDDLPALLEVEFDLYGKDIVFVPPIEATGAKSGLRDLVMRRVEAILAAATVFKRLDSSEGSYLKEMRENAQTQQLVADISGFLDENERACAAFRAELVKYEYLWTTDLPQMFLHFLGSAWRPYPYSDEFQHGLGGLAVSSDHLQVSAASPLKPSLALEPTGEPRLPPPPMPAQLLDLARFDERIQCFLALQNEISEAKHARDVGFVRVNSLPIKQALSTWVTKWIYMFTQYLHDRVVNQLAWLDAFMQRVAAGLDLELEHLPPELEKRALMRCMHLIRDVRRLMREDLLVNFAPLRAVVALLKQNGIALDMSYVGKETVLMFLDQAPLRWELLVNKTFKTKELIQPRQSQMVDAIRAELADFQRRLAALKDEFLSAAPFDAPAAGSQAIADVYAGLDAYHNTLAATELEAARLVELEDMFELAPSKYDVLAALRSDFVLLKHVWDLVALLDAVYVGKWQPLLWRDVDTDALAAEVDAVERQRRGLVPSPRAVKDWPVYKHLEQKLHEMAVILPLVKSLGSPAMRDRHWKSLMVLTRKHFNMNLNGSGGGGGNGPSSNSALRFEEVLKLELFRHVNEVNELVEVASREFKIEQQLHTVEATWGALELEFVPYTTAGRGPSQGSSPELRRGDEPTTSSATHDDAALASSDGDVWVLKPPNAIIERLEEHQLQLQTMAGMGKFVAYFKDRVFEWQQRLGNVDAVLKLWMALQRQWCSLESIFLSASGDLQRQLPAEYQRFEHVDEEMKELFLDAQRAPAVLVACCERDGRELVLRGLHDELEVCQKALNQYLDGKKDVFPRFYFVSNASLLEILSNGNAPPRLQPHFGNCFDGIRAFEFELVHPNTAPLPAATSSDKRKSLAGSPSTAALAERYLATAMVSKEDEVVRFPDSHLVHGPVENWFNDLVAVMQDTLRHRIFDAVESSALWGVDCARHAWVFEYPAQVALLASQVVWTEEVEAALEELENGTEDAVKRYWDVSTVRLEALIKLVQGELPALERQKVITLITVDVHARDVVQSLLAKKVTSSLDFQWQSQLRYYVANVASSAGGRRERRRLGPEPRHERRCDDVVGDAAATCVRVCEQLGLQPEDGFIKKVTEYDDVLKVRHSVMLIGPAGCGKSTIWTTLAACHNAPSRAAAPGAEPPKAVTRVSPSEGAALPGLFAKYVDAFFAVLHDLKLQPIVPVSAIAVVATLCRLLDSVLQPVGEPEKTPEALENAFLYCALWAFGGALDGDKANDQRKSFSTAIKSIAKYKLPPANNAPATGGPTSASSSGGGGGDPANLLHNLSLFDLCFDASRNEVAPWSDKLPAVVGASDGPLYVVMIPTVESTRLHALLALLLRDAQPVMLVGCSGSGKSAVAHEHLKGLDDELASAYITLHHFMDARELQLRLEQHVEKRSGRVFGPMHNRRLVYFLDDLNMPRAEAYGTQTALALLRQFVDYGAWFDRHDLTVKKLMQDVQFLACMNHKAGSFTVNPRLQRHFATLCVNIPPNADLVAIYATLASQHLQGFSDRVKRLAPALVAATVDLYAAVRSSFLPTATKFHHVFSMRELSAVFQGVFAARPASYGTNALRFARLWLHECYRVFSDRMGSASELQRFTEMAVEQTKRHLEEDQSDLFAAPLICAGFLAAADSGSDHDDSDDAGFGDYVPVQDKAQLTACLEHKLKQYNEAFPVMHLVLFDQALEHITRIVRILSSPRGNALLVGVGGSGKQSLSRLAAFICGYALCTLSVSASPVYGLAELREDLKDVYRKAGVRPATPLVLLVTDPQMADPRFLVPLNDLLTSGHVPDLFGAEEMDAMTSSLRPEAKARGVPDTKEQLQAFFYDRVRSNVHLVLACSPVGSELRVRCRRFPALVSCCAVDWFHAWPKEALVDVSLQFLRDVALGSHAIQENVCHHMAEMHASVTAASAQYARTHARYNYVTPTSFLELIRFYRTLLASRRRAQAETVKRLDVGLATLHKTAADVAALQDELRRTMVKVDERKRATDALLEQMGKQRGDAELKQRRADDERAKAARAAEVASAIEAQSAVELALAKPALDAAQQAVNCLNKASLTELKSMGKPPAGVDKVTAAVLMLVKNESRNLSWDNAKKMMAKVDVFKQQLEQFDKENIPVEAVARVDQLLGEDPNFTFEKIKSKSVAAANLAVWVINIIAFHHVYVRVKPLVDTLEDARRQKADADAELAAVQKLVVEVEAQLGALQLSFRDATNEKAKVEAEAHACQERLSLAERLVNGLASENARWSREVDALRAGESALVGDTLLAAGFVSYIGAFNASYRAQLWQHTWLPDLVAREIPITLGTGGSGSGGGQRGGGGGEGASHGGDVGGGGGGGRNDTSSSLSDVEGPGGEVPTDGQGMDPVEVLSDSSAGITWLRSRDFGDANCEPPSGATSDSPPPSSSADRGDELPPLVILHQSQKHWMKTLKAAISSGRSVILENLGETIDAALEPVLMRQIYRKGRSWCLHFSAEEVAFDPRFRLYLHTKLPNPHYRPETLAYCTLLDFSVTESGLEDQILASIVNLEQPALERQKQALQQEFNGYQIQLRQLETQLLERLSSAPDDILSDVPLIEGLEQTKLTANEVAGALRRGREAEKEINLAREVYRPVASEASMLYFLMGQLCKVNHMYRYSLEVFMTFFFVAMSTAAPRASSSAAATGDATSNNNNNNSSTPQSAGASYAAAFERVPVLKEAVRWTLFLVVSRGLFEEHKLLFLTQLVLLLLRRGAIGLASGFSEEAAQFLLQGPKAVGPESAVAWLGDSQWQALQALVALEPFERFVADLEESEARFREWYNAASPETEKLPLDWRELDKSAPFLKLLVVKCLRPDRLTQAISNFIATTLPHGAQYLGCDAQLSSYAVLCSAYRESAPWTPMYFVLSPGTDVVGDVDRLAEQGQARLKGVDYHNIALGQGQERLAMATLQLSVENGHWVILNNVHLMPTWLLELEKWLEQVAKASKTASHASLSLNMSSLLAATGAAGSGRSQSAVMGSGGSGGLHPSFRLFITSDPSPHIPIGLLERSIKLTNEPPTGLKANLKRALGCFSKPLVDELEPRTRCVLFALCYFHALMLERKTFGAQGFNMAYPFAASDLLASSTVLRNYMENAPARVPWQDLRYLFGEIMYGGHIVNELDRLVCATYLGYFLRDELLDELSMVPFSDDAGHGSGGGVSVGGGGEGSSSGDSGSGDTGGAGAGGGAAHSRRDFLAPKLSAGFDRILEHVEHNLQSDSPVAFGLHPNAEVAFRTAHGETLVKTVLALTRSDGGDTSGDSGARSSSAKDSADAVQLVAEGVLQDILESYRELRFDVHELLFKTSSSSEPHGSAGAKGGRSASSAAALALAAAEEMDPFQNVLVQECERMNALLDEMTRSLVELEMGFRGDVTLTDAMERLQRCLFLERVPPSWEAAAFPSRRSLAPWLANVQQRIAQLQDWSAQAPPELPLVLWLPGLFNPQSFLTAVLQTCARRNVLELDKLSVATDVTKRSVDAVDAPSRDGQYIHGLALEGARWDVGSGALDASLPKEMYVVMPVMNCRAIVTAATMAARKEGGGAGAGGGGSGVFDCPVYKTQQRGPTYVFSAQLRTKAPPSKWILAGVALLLEVV
ncbi:hypothetical protein PybrP1_011234 [[Pythium] brassicae (nom. inval.)]|nr:hypothetical protein PybrP1_011234 [[Pythium] brassicae (nom. inval.)]